MAYTHAFMFPSLPLRGQTFPIQVSMMRRSLEPTRTSHLPVQRYKLRARSDAPAPAAYQEWFQAARSGDIPSMTRLIRSGAISTALVREQKTGRTALHAAAADSDAATVRAVFELARGVGGARQDFMHRTGDALWLVSLADNHGSTPLHFAAARSDEDSLAVVKALLALGANSTATDENGVMPVDVARERGRRDVLEAL